MEAGALRYSVHPAWPIHFLQFYLHAFRFFLCALWKLGRLQRNTSPYLARSWLIRFCAMLLSSDPAAAESLSL